jgi:hypothetical protein
LNNGGELKEGFSSLKAQRSNPGELLLYNCTKLKEQFREINKKFFFNNSSYAYGYGGQVFHNIPLLKKGFFTGGFQRKYKKDCFTSG